MEKRDYIKSKIDYLKKDLPTNSEGSEVEFLKQSSHTGDYNVTRLFMRRQYPRTFTKFEIIELDQHILDLIRSKNFSWDFMREYFEKMGYATNLVRERFKALTGIDPEEHYYKIYESAVINVPMEIPVANLGWGKSKDSKYDYYFVNPGIVEFAIYGQKGELQRDLISEYPSLSLALKDLEKLVSEVYTLEKPFELNVIDKTPPLSDQIRSYASEEDGEVVEELKQLSPNDFFERELTTLDKNETSVSEIVQKVLDYINEKDQAINDFRIEVKSFKYKNEEIEEILEQMTPVLEENEVEKYFNKEAVISVLVEFKYNNVEDKSKFGLIVFTIKDDEIFTNDTFKGEDNKIYALTSEGLYSYFKDKIDKESHLFIFDN